jgi:hypothetical protein
MFYTRYWVKVGIATVVAVAAGVTLVELTRPPVLKPVAVLTKPVEAMHSIPKGAVRWTKVTVSPSGALPPHVNWSSLVASQALVPGTILTNADFTAGQIDSLHPGEVQWLAPVTAVSGGLAVIGQRVDAWSDTKGSFQLIAYGVRVTGLYSSGGNAVTAAASSSNSGSSTGMVALAVPASAIGTFLNITTPYLVVDPNQPVFRLATASTRASTKHASSTKNARAILPTTKGG